jgi:ketosteroid isomerase-like protein
MSSKNVESMRAVAEAFNRRDVEGLERLLADDVEIVPIRAAVEAGTVYLGPDAVAQWYAAVDASWDELRAEVEDLRDGGDRVLASGRIRGRGRESGAVIDVEAASVAHFRNGLITRLQHYSNRAEAGEAFQRRT